MVTGQITRGDCFGLVRPAVDAHTLGLASVAQLLGDCGYPCVLADGLISACLNAPEAPENLDRLSRWITEHRITVLGFSYRLDPQDGARAFAGLVNGLKTRRLLKERGGPLRALFFAGLPQTCEWVRERVPEVSAVFMGDETAAETLERLGIDASDIPAGFSSGVRYDEIRLAFGRELIRSGEYLAVKPVDRSGYREYGSRQDTLMARLQQGAGHHWPPLMRAHVGPYLSDRDEAVHLFLDWCQQLAAKGFLDILSVGTSQLTQSNFGDPWEGIPNGGGVPLNSKGEFEAVWQAARPMLVRAYAGTRDVATLARMHEETLNIAWHALSLWWFCKSDGRGPNSVRDNLVQHISALRYIALTGKPFEANVSHHFAFRGADDVTYVVSAVIAAKVAKSQGIRHYILQNMLNTPKYTWGVQDLAKSRAMLKLVRELEDERFHVILQPRGGLDYFSHDLEKAKAQLAAVTALMDDIEPDNPLSPGVIHVVSYSEGAHLADPATVNESIQITRQALVEYRKLRRKGDIPNMSGDPDVVARTAELVAEARIVIRAIETTVPGPYTAEGLYRILAQGFLPVPYLWECREEFSEALQWQTRLVRGGVKVVDAKGDPVSVADRMAKVCASRLGPVQGGNH